MFYSLSETNIPSIFKKCTQASAVSYIDDFVLDKQWQLTLPSSWKTCTHLTQVLASTLLKYIEVKITSKHIGQRSPTMVCTQCINIDQYMYLDYTNNYAQSINLMFEF